MSREVNPQSKQNAAEDEWRGILGKGEKILWQGQPKAGFQWAFNSAFEPFFFLFFTGFSVFWMAGASLAGGFFWMFGLLFFGVGSWNLLFKHFWKTHVRSRTFYTLTNKSAYIATNSPFMGKKLNVYPIHSGVPLEFEMDVLSSVYFAKKTVNGQNGKSEVRIGFERLSDGRHVYDLILDAQKKEAS